MADKEFITTDDRDLPLHECVFSGDLRELSVLLRKGNDVAKKDKHGMIELNISSINPNYCTILAILISGNTALHLAVMLGKKGKIWNIESTHPLSNQPQQLILHLYL